jgi:hypothetical protein
MSEIAEKKTFSIFKLTKISSFVFSIVVIFELVSVVTSLFDLVRELPLATDAMTVLRLIFYPIYHISIAFLFALFTYRNEMVKSSPINEVDLDFIL